MLPTSRISRKSKKDYIDHGVLSVVIAKFLPVTIPNEDLKDIVIEEARSSDEEDDDNGVYNYSS
ncbi:hypothetical protein FRX31_003215 [Thalictrum thalictroides]|uniref:Uncharacterized protein n=1 Tax=Thalictrum thalictroides TaxID=46969 RepID=A0A7J6XBT3_THATH|nr:hypothetical protein FRX31_003215 [Thalictrum thalictroides]